MDIPKLKENGILTIDKKYHWRIYAYTTNHHLSYKAVIYKIEKYKYDECKFEVLPHKNHLPFVFT